MSFRSFWYPKPRAVNKSQSVCGQQKPECRAAAGGITDNPTGRVAAGMLEHPATLQDESCGTLTSTLPGIP